MRKKDFLRELRTRLNRTKCKDVDDIIEYYDELIEDTMDRTGQTEMEVIEDLGSITDIILRVNPLENRPTEKEEKIHYDEFEASPKKIAKAKVKSKDTIVLGIIVALLTAPLWFSLLITLVSLIIAAVAVGVSIGIAGIYCIIYGAITFGNGFANALFQIGIGITFIGVTFIISPLIIKFITWMIKIIIKFIKWLVGASKNKGRSACYEN